jgi:hypothetical protein
MKKSMCLLVIINLMLLAYFNFDYLWPSMPVAKVSELNPEKISLLSQQQIDALPKKEIIAAEPVITVASTSCYEWGIFSASSITEAQTAVSKLSLQPTTKEQTSKNAKRFWIYKAPLKSAQEAQAKALQLKALGVQDLFVVQEPRWRNAISFGVFEDEKLAIKLLNELKAKGVRDVVKTLRNQGKGHFSLLFNHLAEPQVAEINMLKANFPEADLKEVACN